MANRINRINEEARKEISAIIRELKDPRVTAGLCSVVAVDITKDLRWCKVFVSVLGDGEKRDAALEGLKSAAGFVRKELAHRLAACGIRRSCCLCRTIQLSTGRTSTSCCMR